MKTTSLSKEVLQQKVERLENQKIMASKMLKEMEKDASTVALAKRAFSILKDNFAADYPQSSNPLICRINNLLQVFATTFQVEIGKLEEDKRELKQEKGDLTKEKWELKEELNTKEQEIQKHKNSYTSLSRTSQWLRDEIGQKKTLHIVQLEAVLREMDQAPLSVTSLTIVRCRREVHGQRVTLRKSIETLE